MMKYLLAVSIVALAASATPLIGQPRKPNPICQTAGQHCSNDKNLYCCNGLTCKDPATGKPSTQGMCIGGGAEPTAEWNRGHETNASSETEQFFQIPSHSIQSVILP